MPFSFRTLPDYGEFTETVDTFLLHALPRDMSDMRQVNTHQLDDLLGPRGA